MITNKEIEAATDLVIPKVFLNHLPEDYRGSLLRTVKLEQTAPDKVSLIRFSDYVTVIKVKLQYFPYGIKSTETADQNYRAKYSFTRYFTPEGIEIHDKGILTNRQIFNRLKRDYETK